MNYQIQLLCQLLLFSTTALSFYTSSSSEEYEELSDKVQFYYSRGSYHVTNVGNASFTCIKIAKYKDGRRWSEDVDGGICVLLYAQGDCSGPTIVAPPGYDSSFVYDDVGSFSPCPPPNYAQVSLYADTGFNSLMARYGKVNECKTLPSRVAGRTQSVHTHGTCVRLYEHIDCTGEMLEVKPASLYHWDLARFEYENKAQSVSGCGVCTGLNFQAKITKVKFTNTLRDDLLKGKLFKVDMAWTHGFRNNGTAEYKKKVSDTRTYKETFRFEKIASLSTLHKVEIGRDFSVESGFSETDEGTKSSNVDSSSTHLQEKTDGRSGQHSTSHGSGRVTGQGSAVGTNQQTHVTVDRGTNSGTNRETGSTTGHRTDSSRTAGTETEVGRNSESGRSRAHEHSSSDSESSKHTAGASVSASGGFFGLASWEAKAHYNYEKSYAKSSESKSSSNSFNKESSRYGQRTHSSTNDSHGSYGESRSGTGSHQSESANTQLGANSGSHRTSSSNSQNSATSQASSNSAFGNQNRKMSSSQNTLSSFSQKRKANQNTRTDSTKFNWQDGSHTSDGAENREEYVSETIREFSIEEVFTVNPCVNWEMNAYIMEMKDMPMEFDMELEFSEEEGCLNYEQLRTQLPPGMEYVRAVNEFSILARTKGRIIAKLGVKTEMEIHESSLPDCQKRLQDMNLG